MTRLWKIIRSRIFLAASALAFCACTLSGFWFFAASDRAARMEGGEIVSEEQALWLGSRADNVVLNLKSFLAVKAVGVRYEDLADIRMELQSVSLELQRVHHPDQQRPLVASDALAAIATQLNKRGASVQDMISMLGQWEHAVRRNDAAAASSARASLIGAVATTGSR